MRPVNKGVSPYDSIAKYEDAEPYLNERIGRYCSFCELPIFHVPEVEHKEGKKSGGDITRWENLLYGCKYCNTRKAQKIKAGELNKWIWPDKDNTFLAFTYTNGLPKVNEAYLKSISEDVYIKTVSLFNGICLNFCPKNVRDKDKRWQKRIETLGQAERSRIFWNKICDTELRNEGLDTITTLAKALGFFSIWMMVFEDDRDIKNALIDAFPGTARECFDDDGNAVRRENGEI